MEVKWIRSKPIFSKFWFFLIFLFLLLTVPLTGAALWFNWATSAVAAEKSEEKTFVIQLNEPITSIAGRLKQEGLIRDELAFRLYTRFSCEGVSLTNPLSLLSRPSVESCLGGKIQA